MNKGAKIGLGIVILIIGFLGLLAITSPVKYVNDTNGIPKPTTTPSYLVYGTVNEEVRVGNLGITVFTPTYSNNFYEDVFPTLSDNLYTRYTARDSYHFALVKTKVINHGIEETYPSFDDMILETKEGLRYKESSGFNHTTNSYTPTPSPILKDFTSYSAILPRESNEGYFYFEIPKKAKVDELQFKYDIPSEIDGEKEIIIDL